MRTYNDSNKHTSNKATGKYTSNGRISLRTPARTQQESQYTPVIMLWVLVATFICVFVTVAYVALQVLS